VRSISIHLPESKRLRLQQAAKARGLTVNQLMNQLASEAIAELDRHFARPRRTS
jgi:hypothetical protein